MKLTLLLAAFFCSIANAGALIIGTLPLNPPYEISVGEKGNFSGFEIDIMNEICHRLRMQCVYKGLTFEQLFTELLAGNVNLSIGSLVITEDRKEDFIFSSPLLNNPGQLVTTARSKIKNVNEVIDKKVGVMEGTIFPEVLQKKFNDRVKIKKYASRADLMQSLSKGEVDVVMVDKAVADYWIANNSESFKLLGSLISLPGMGTGIMANKKEVELMQTIDKVLAEIAADGTYNKIYSLYFANMMQ